MESDSLSSSPILRVTADISEMKTSYGSAKHINTSKIGSRESRNYLTGNAYSRKKILHPINGCHPYQGRNNYCGSYMQNAKNNVSTFTQRVMSAKLLRVKQLQNQLTESQNRVAELINENKLLKTLQRRQDNALKKYEGSQEQLPQLIKSHNEEIRIINAKFKQLKLNYKVLENKLKDRDTELINLREQHKHLLKLSRDKQLCDREKLTKKLEETEAIVKSQQEKIQMLNRKVDLEGKNYRHRLNAEINKHKATRAELLEARKTIDKLKQASDGGRPKYVNMEHAKKIVRPLTHTNQHSRSSLPAPPPSVSIRQPQRLVQSETAFNRQEDSDSDSFSFGLGNALENTKGEDSCSDRSDSEPEADEKFNRVKRTNNNSLNRTSLLPNSRESVNKLNYVNGSSTVSSDNSHNNLVRSFPRSAEPKMITRQRNTVNPNIVHTDTWENKNSTKFDQQSLESSKFKSKSNNIMFTKKVLGNISNPPSNSKTNNNLKNDDLSRNILIENQGKSLEKTESFDSVKTNISDSADGVSSTVTDTSPDDDIAINTYDDKLLNMQKEIEKELDNIMYKTNERNTSELIEKDHTDGVSMEAAIEELERKFKVFDMPQIRKETEEDINRIVDRACQGLFDDEVKNENETSTISDISQNKNINPPRENDDFLSKLENCFEEVNQNPQPDILLGEKQKANLLLALNNIDQENNDGDHLGNLSLEKFKNSPSSSFNKFKVMNKAARRDVIKELFIEESVKVATND